MTTSFILLLIVMCNAKVNTLLNDADNFLNLKGPIINVNADLLNIHLIPHTHDDIGYIKTLDQYFYDGAKEINIEGVQYILDAIFPYLDNDRSKKFIYVEIGFFKRWWDEQNDATKSLVKRLLTSKQFQFINGGYCMNDEAAVYYEDSIDQMTLGHQFLLENFNVTPDIGWHIDPFGHASAQAALFAQMGFKAFFFARIDYQDQVNRMLKKGMEMVWIPDTSQGIENAIFSHVNYFHYGSPFGFDFDIVGHDQPIRDNPDMEDYDVQDRAAQFVAWFRLMQQGYKLTGHLMHTIGGDFQFMAPGMNFKNLDKLMRFIAKSPEYNVNITFNTPSEYLDIIYSLNNTYPVNNYDFFPYADVINAYWTGYFTSRTAIKGLVRRQGKLLQAAKRLATQLVWQKSSSFVLKNWNQVDKALYQLEEAMAIAQHHDAVTGTERQAVAEDYKLRLALGENSLLKNFLNPFFQERVQKDLGLSSLQFETCQLNTSATFCSVTYQNLNKGTPVLVAIYNSGQSRSSVIRLKVPNGKVQVVQHQTGADLPTDVICSNSTDTTDCDLFFKDDFSSFGISYYYLKPSTISNQVSAQNFVPNTVYPINSNQSITTTTMSSYVLTFCQDSTHQSCSTTQFNLKYNYYESYQTPNGQQSGAYIFRPTDKTSSSSLPYATPQSASIYLGKNLLQIHLNSPNIIADLRIYGGDLSQGVELQTFVNSISVDDGQGKEVVLIVEVPSINNQNNFYTDSMGMEMQRRVLNYRPTWNLQVVQPISSNYYPIQSTIFIQDPKTDESFAVLPDRAQGGTSLYAGQIEVMLNRRMLNDDSRGVGEALNETDWDGQGLRQWVTHTLLFNKTGFSQTKTYRQVQLDNDVSNIVMLAATNQTPELLSIPQKDYKFDNFNDFGQDIKLLSRPLSLTKFLLRFHNTNEFLSNNISTKVFSNSQNAGGTVTEMSLTANQPKLDMIKKRFNWNGLDLNNPSYAKTDYLDSDHFTLRPQEIRTFIVQFSSNKQNQNEEEIIHI